MPWGGCFRVIRVTLFRLQVLMLMTTLIMVVNGWHSLDSLTTKGGIEIESKKMQVSILSRLLTSFCNNQLHAFTSNAKPV